MLDPSSPVSTVLLATRDRCGLAVDGDEVVVEILHEKRLDSRHAASAGGGGAGGSEYTPQAQVLGVLRRQYRLTDRLMVCRVSPDNTGQLIPINSGYPHVFNLETPARAQRARKGLVTVYRITRSSDVVFHRHEQISAMDSKLFVCRCLRWDHKFHSPIGVVLDVIPAG